MAGAGLGSMTVFDYAFLVVLVLSVCLGLWRGLVSEILALVAWSVAFVLARMFVQDLVPLIAHWVEAPWLRSAIAFGSIFIVTLLVLGLIRVALRSLLTAVGLAPLDRLLGAGFGVVRALLLAFLVVAVAGMTALPRQPWWREAAFAEPLETAVIAAKPWMPKDLAERIKYRY